ncbi:FHA domain-containing protein [Mycolicibacterium sp. jd]|uniref:FHA domain-containing protein n=1 Tax=unclassified Mycolicibacterium TaxID=2636767 RepID=UPI00351ADF24
MKHQNSAVADDGASEATAAFHAAGLDESDTAAAVGAGALQGQLPRGSALLVVQRGPNAGSRFRLDQPITSVGRHPASDIFLDDVTTSRRHAEFRRVNGNWEVVDMNSLNGTYLNGQPLHDKAALADGDQIQFGKFRLMFLARDQ